MNRFLSPFFLICVFVFTLSAHADTITTFSMSGYHTDTRYPGFQSGTVTGTFTVDTTSGVVQSIDFFVADHLLKVDSGWGPTTTGYVELFEAFDFSLTHNVGFTSVDFELPVSTLVGYTGGFICSTSNVCPDGGSTFSRGPGGHNAFVDGVVSPVGAVSPVPEPGSLVLLSTGVLGLLGAGWRRRRGSAHRHTA